MRSVLKIGLLSMVLVGSVAYAGDVAVAIMPISANKTYLTPTAKS